MRPPGSFKLAGRARSSASHFDPIGCAFGRSQKIIESLRNEIVAGCDGAQPQLRIRQIFETPREIYRVEFEVPELSYHRTTLLDRDALEDLLETDEIRKLVRNSLDG